MQITDTRIVELTGTIDDPEVYWEERSVHPADDYPELRRIREAEWPKSGDQPYRVRMTFVEIVTDGGLVGTAGPIMLGGPTRKRVPAYVSTLGTSLEPERASATAARFAKLGFGAMKWFPRFGPADGVEGLRRNVELVRVLREAIGGDVRLMIDAWMSWDVPYTLEFAELTADHDLYWIEDPVMPERLDGLAELSRERGNRPRLASGERAYTRVKSGFERRAHGSEADRAR